MVSADIAFQHAANAAAVYAASVPAYVSYTVDSVVTVPSMRREKDIACREVTRTADGRTVITDLPHGRVHPEASPFPFSPAFDAVSYFHLAYAMSMRGVASFNVSEVVPMTFQDIPAAHANDADVVVTSTRAYRVRYAPDSSAAADGTTHLFLHPYATTISSAPRSSFFFSDVKIDNATGLPSQVTFTGVDDLLMTIDYAQSGGRFGAVHARFEQTVHGPFRIGRVHFIADARFHDVVYGPTAPPELTPFP